MATEAEGLAALEEAQRIADSLGIGDMDGPPADPNELVARLEGGPGTEQQPGEDEATTTQDDTAKGEKPAAPAGSSTAATPKADGKAAASPEGGEKSTETPGEQQPAGVLLKDGKHFLPYEKHAEERRLRMEAETRAKQLEAELAALKAGKTGSDAPAAGEQGGEGAHSTSTGTLEGDLALIDELEAQAKAYEDEGLTNLAELTAKNAKLMRAMANQLQAMGGYVKMAQEREAQEQTRRQQTVQEQVAEAIENNPKLRFLQDTMEKDPTSGELWDMIADQDKLLRANPKFAAMSFADRFDRAVKMVEAVHGPIKLPPEYQTVADVKAAAKAEADKAGEFQPHTLSDLPGGGSPRGGGETVLSDLDPTQLERIMMEASPEKIADILARVG